MAQSDFAKEIILNAPQQLHRLGQRLWLDNITRALLTSGTLSRYIAEFAITGLTSNPTIFDQAIRSGDFYDEAIRKKSHGGMSGEALFFELAPVTTQSNPAKRSIRVAKLSGSLSTIITRGAR